MFRYLKSYCVALLIAYNGYFAIQVEINFAGSTGEVQHPDFRMDLEKAK